MDAKEFSDRVKKVKLLYLFSVVNTLVKELQVYNNPFFCFGIQQGDI